MKTVGFDEDDADDPSITLLLLVLRVAPSKLVEEVGKIEVVDVTLPPSSKPLVPVEEPSGWSPPSTGAAALLGPSPTPPPPVCRAVAAPLATSLADLVLRTEEGPSKLELAMGEVKQVAQTM